MEITTGPATVTDMLLAQAGRIQPGLCLALGGEPGAWDDGGVPPGRGSAEPLWRAIAVFRFAGLGYAVLLVVINRIHYSRPDWAWAVIAVMTAWTVVTTMAYARRDFLLRRGDIAVVLNGVVLLLLAGVVVGHLARLAAEVETERQHLAGIEAASRERERLARDIHDSVLQVLALVQRRGAEAGGAAAELGRLAGQQEAALRALVGTAPAVSAAGDVDLRSMLLPIGSEQVTVSVPAQPVRLHKSAADELTSAIRAALDNVRRHCGERARAGCWSRTSRAWSP